MYYLVALGNPGEKYIHTRHNVGWRVADFLTAKLGAEAPREVSAFRGVITEVTLATTPVLVFYPHTFMNHSGEAVRVCVPADESARLIVIHDEIDLPFGKLRLSKGSQAGGHNGVASIIHHLHTSDFIRVRIGIGRRESDTPRPPGGEALERYVLSRFTPEEEEALPAVFEKAVAVLTTLVGEGFLKAKEMHGV